MISVIIIGRNEGERLVRCLKSLQCIHYLKHEVIYVDSGSADGSVDAALSAGASVYILNEKHPTPGLGRRVGASRAKGEWLLFLDGDMQLQKGFVEKALNLVYDHKAEAVTGIRNDEYISNGSVRSTAENYFHCTRERICPEFGGALFISAEALKKCGGWSGNTVACEEAELHARLTGEGVPVLEIPVPMILHSDAVRDTRSPLSVIFSRRRLGEGQAFVCAMKNQHAAAYIRRDPFKFIFYLLDWIALLSLLFMGAAGIIAVSLLECLQLGYFGVRRRPRAFVSQKLFFFAFPLGILTWRKHSEDCREVHA